MKTGRLIQEGEVNFVRLGNFCLLFLTQPATSLIIIIITAFFGY
jgi:hypothetical protein